MSSRIFPVRAAFLALLVSLMSLISLGGAGAQTVYTWNAAGSANWNTTADWTSSGPGTTWPGAGDTANIGGLATGTATLTYDTGESGQLGTLNMIGTTGAGTMNVYLAHSLTLGAGGSLYDNTASGYENLVFSASNTTLTIGDGTNASTFTYGNAANTRSTSQQVLTSGGGVTGTNIVIANASTFDWVNVLGSFLTAVPMEVQSGGVLKLDSAGSGQKYIIGNLTVDSGGQVTSGGTYAGSGALYVQGSSLVLNGQITGLATSGNNLSGVVLSNLAAAGGSSTQTVSFGSGANAVDLTLRPSTSAANTTNIVKVSSSATGSVGYAQTGTNIVDSLNYYGNGVNGNTLIYQLGSNLTFGGTAGSLYYGSTAAAGVITDVLDLNGYTYDMSTAGKSFSIGWSTSGTNSASSLISFTNSAGSASPATLKATYFNSNTAPNAANTAVGSYVILQAANGGTLNDLGNSAGTGTIDALSTFLYTGSGYSTLASNRSLGGITVGTGTATVSTLSLGTAITAAGITTVTANSILDLYNAGSTGGSTKGAEGSYALTTAGLSGAGTIENKTTGTGTAITATTVTVNNTGATGIATSNTFSGTITDTAVAPLSVTLASTNTGTQILSGANTYSGTTTVSGGKLLVANTTGSATGSGAITVASGASFGGSGIVNPTGTNKMTVSGNLILGTAGSAATSLTVSAASNTLGSGTAMVDLTGAGLSFNLGSGNTSSELKLTSAYLGEVAGLSGNAFSFTDLTSGSLSSGEYTLILSDSTSANPFQGLSLGTLSGFTLTGLTGYTGQLELNTVGGKYALQLDLTAAPEPSAVALALLALSGFALIQVRRRVLTS